MNKNWIHEDNKHILVFTPYGEDEILAEVFNDENGDWCYSSELLEEELDYLICDSLEEAKKDIESMVESHYTDMMEYYKEMLEKFLK